MKLRFWFALAFIAAFPTWSATFANPATTAMQPTSATIYDAAKLLEFRELPCPSREGAGVWLQAIEDRSLSRDHRLAALTYLILRHGNGKALDEIKKWATIVGVKDSEWKRLTRLGGYLPIRKLDLGAGVYRLQLELKKKVVVSISVQLRSERTEARESAAVVLRVLQSCE